MNVNSSPKTAHATLDYNVRLKNDLSYRVYEIVLNAYYV